MNSTLIWIIAIAAVVIVVAFIIRKKMPVGPDIPDGLRKGEKLPEFSATHEDGTTVNSSDLLGRPAVILFVRGNWCPFCSKQVEEITAHYKSISDLGAKLIFITPKPLGTTRRVAEMFGVEFDFWLDESLEIAKSLGILMSEGVPESQYKEYGHNTSWPTALVVDKDGVIRYSKLSRLLFDRPNSEALVKELKKL
jgi:peroxiredoxin